jgi:hypothetical protein
MPTDKNKTPHEPHEGLEHPPRPMADEDERVDESIDESFPASDPPSFTPSRTGAPSKKPDSPNTGRTE